ncbi:hypothetical protein [Halomonas organivorans]|uniref:Uncharacterized protein n=1 Tax=Halomonas organivorans TaxID=257772 RepID=A0A7W5BWQ5_9GAMM|nr:hypothetical protein [Halomonas organivorans]MBB3140229.1 hypothetical protein [Halomonas organivorans]
MNKMIRDVSELPEWFDIRPYEQWEDKDPYEAAMSVSDRLWIKDIISSGFVIFDEDTPGCPGNTREAVLEKLSEISSCPYERNVNKLLIEIFHERCKEKGSFDYKGYLSERRREEEQFSTCCAHEVDRILGHKPSVLSEDGISQVTLADMMEWLKENEELVKEIDRTAERLSAKNGWDTDSVRIAIQRHIPVRDSDMGDFLMVDPYPTIPTVIRQIEGHLRSLPGRNNGADRARYSDVRKLFEYRVAAYADLESWSFLTGCTITKKCMASALFGGRYGEVDMMPSKTVGRFIRRVEGGYIDDLTAKSSEMESMHS